MFEIVSPSLIARLRFLLTSTVSNFLGLFGYTQRQLVVCGYPRSGTSLIYNMLSASLGTHFKFLPFENYFIYSIHRIGSIATKAPMDLFHLKELSSLNVNNKDIIVIIMVRDIREILTSKHPIYPDEYFIGYDSSFWPQTKEFTEWAYNAPGIINIYEEICRVKDLKGVKLIKYESLVLCPDSVQDKINDRFDLHFVGEFSNYHLDSKELPYKYEGKYKANNESLVLEGKQVVNKEARWRKEEYKDRIVSQFKACPQLFDILIDYGYEKDRSWFDLYID
jgi:hypothetical protein